MTEIGLLEHIFDRLGRADSAEEIFGADEAADWPAGELDLLIKVGLLRRAEPAQRIECKGCEQYCFMPVNVLPAEGNRPARAFISCDKRNDIGRVPVEMRRLEQWQTTCELIADVLARLLGFSRSTSTAAEENQWHIGVLKGKKYKSLVTLLADDNLNLSLAGHTVPLIEMLAINENALTLDKGELIRLVDQPAAHNEAPDVEEIEVSAFGNDEVEMSATTTFKPSASASEIRRQFTVIKSEDANDKWWKKMMRNASDNRLKECRVGGGRKGAVGSLWRPDLVAGWLVDRRAKGRDGMSKEQARAALKKFPGCSEIAQEFFSTDE